MTLQFPSSPSNNDVYENYIYNSTAGAWQKLPGNAFADAAVSDTPPVNPNNGDLWLNSADAKMYIYYNDGDSSQWIAAVGGTVPSQGKIIAVKDAIFTGTQVASSIAAGGNVAVTDLSITHEVANASNKLIISAFLGVAASSQSFAPVGLAVHDGTGLIAVGASPDSRTPVSAGGAVEASGSTNTVTMPSVTFVHTPGAGSKTYTVRAINISGVTRTLYVNRSEDDTDNADRARGVSSLVIQEVSV